MLLKETCGTVPKQTVTQVGFSRAVPDHWELFVHEKSLVEQGQILAECFPGALRTGRWPAVQ